jgi:hydrogenase maturation protein HypF
MEIFNIPTKNNKIILALGAESAGNFSIYYKSKIFLSDNFGDLLNEDNFIKFQKVILNFLEKEKIKPEIIITDLHPLYKTTLLGKNLSKKYNAKHIEAQHHLAHIFSAIGEDLIKHKKFDIQYPLFGIAMDGTGFGNDDKIWGGEIFECQTTNNKYQIKRVGHLENQVLLGSELAIREPARMLISILNKFLDKKELYKYVKKYYTLNQFELLYNQLQQNFNCQETSSTGRILDAVSVLLGFSDNKRAYKHEATELLEKNSTSPYILKPKISLTKSLKILNTTYLFEYLTKNLRKDKKRLAATAQMYLANGLYRIMDSNNFFFAGGITNNKIISDYLLAKGGITNEKIPRGDAGLSFGQIIFYLSTNPGD